MNEKYFLNLMDAEFKPNHEPISATVYYTEQDYQELQRNLVLYKQGNREAVTYIVRMFHPFITKYTSFVKYGNLPYSKYTNRKGEEHYKVSPTISKFVSLFIDKKEAPNREAKKKLFSSTCIKIRILFSKYEYSEIYNELVLALLNMANKYKITQEGDKYHKQNGTFHMYVSKCFHWEAYRFLGKLIHDPLTHFDILSLRDQFDDMDKDDITGEVFVEDEESMFVFDEILDNVSRQNSIDGAKTLTMKEDDALGIYDIESLNFNWTNGVTCGELFETLSPYEREILLLSFIEKKNDIQIGEIYGCHRATINEHKKRAIKKVAEKARELNYLYEDRKDE